MSKVAVDVRYQCSRMPGSRGAENGHQAVVEPLLVIGKVEIDIRDDRM